jgi:hypothetical protein
MSERDMTAPVTRGELHQDLEIWAGAIRAEADKRFAAVDERFAAVEASLAELKQLMLAGFAEMRALWKATEQNLLARVDAMFDPHRDVPERVGKLEEAALPERVSKLETRVFAPKRRARKKKR